MFCDNCKERPACMHITKIANGQKTEKHLCEQCAQSMGESKFSFSTDFSVQDFLKGMFSGEPAEGIPRKSDNACLGCGMTYADFKRSGKMGCGSCYNSFGQRIEPLLRRVHGASMHTGKVPKRTGGVLELKQRLRQSKLKLAGHIAREEFEHAAKVRDEIRNLEKELNVQG